MTNLEKYNAAFTETFEIGEEQLPGLKYQDIAAWDSVGHMNLVAALEDAFDIEVVFENLCDCFVFVKVDIDIIIVVFGGKTFHEPGFAHLPSTTNDQRFMRFSFFPFDKLLYCKSFHCV